MENKMDTRIKYRIEAAIESLSLEGVEVTRQAKFLITDLLFSIRSDLPTFKKISAISKLEKDDSLKPNHDLIDRELRFWKYKSRKVSDQSLIHLERMLRDIEKTNPSKGVITVPSIIMWISKPEIQGFFCTPFGEGPLEHEESN